MIIGKQIIRLKDVNSTNFFASDLIKNEVVPDGTVITAEMQTKGKGHSGSIWESNTNENILISIILYPSFLHPEKHFYLSKFISIGICKFVRSIVPETYIKWPNDIICNKKKICGILIENVIESYRIKSSVIGIGLNINQESFAGNFTATSLLIETGINRNLQKTLQCLILFLNKEYNFLLEGRFPEIDQEYTDLLYQYMKWAKYRTKCGEIEGKIAGVSPDGELIIENKNKKQENFGFKEVAFL